MNLEPLTIEAVFANGVLRPVTPLALAENQQVRITVTAGPAERPWPDDVADIYRELAEEDRRLAAGMFGDVRSTWPLSGEAP